MACRLTGAKTLSEPLVDICKLDPREQIPMKFSSKYINFLLRKCVKYCLENGGYFASASMCLINADNVLHSYNKTNGSFNNKPALVQEMAAWHQSGTKPLPEPMLTNI